MTRLHDLVHRYPTVKDLRGREGFWLASLNCPSTMVVRARIVTGDTLSEPSFASWFLAMKSEEGNKATFSNWPRLDTSFATQAWRPKLARSSFESKMFEVCVFHRLKGCFCELIENRKVPFRKIPGTFGTIPVKTGE